MSDVLTSAQLQTYVEHGFLCWRGRDSFLTCPGLPQHHPSGTPLEEPDHFATFYCLFFFFLINLCWKIDSDILCHRLNLFPISCPNNEKYTSAFSPGPLLTFSEGSGTQHRGWCFLDVWSQGEATCFHNSSANIWLHSPKWGFAKLTSQKPVDLSLGKQTKIFWRV